jgi:hypothetical protein
MDLPRTGGHPNVGVSPLWRESEWGRRRRGTGHAASSAAQHLHGGIGVDTEYPLFRYFRWTRQIELTLGGAALHLVQLGARIAARAGA